VNWISRYSIGKRKRKSGRILLNTDMLLIASPVIGKQGKTGYYPLEVLPLI